MTFKDASIFWFLIVLEAWLSRMVVINQIR